MNDDLPLTAAGRTVPDPMDRIRRYCGLPWSGGPPETWAWQYYDAVPVDLDDTANATDVLAAGALHPGLSRPELAFFRERHTAVTAWLAEVPADAKLWEADEDTLAHLAALTSFEAEVSLTLLSKVLHRKRPDLIPLVDRHVIDWYRPLTGERRVGRAWSPLIQALHEDLSDDRNRLLMSIARVQLEGELGLHPEGERRLSWLRMLDIAIWMGSK